MYSQIKNNQLRLYFFLWILSFIFVQAFNTTIEFNQCGRDRGCILFPLLCHVSGGSKCSHAVTFKRDGDYFMFNIMARTTGYVGFGLSEDDKMGNDESVICTYDAVGHRIFVQSAQNHPRKFVILNNRTNNEFHGLGGTITNNGIGFTNRELQCRFNRYYKLKSKFGNKTISYDLINGTYYVFLASGDVASQTNKLPKHQFKPLVSRSKIAFAETKIHFFMGLKRRFQIHAVLGSIGWLFFYSIGIAFARHTRLLYTHAIFGKAIWFWCHTTCMVFSFVFSLSCIMYQIVADGKWSKTDQVERHGSVGIIATILAFFNIVGGLLRPENNSKFRPVFNQLHRWNGLLAFLFATISIWLGLFMTKKMNSDCIVWGAIVLAVWTAFLIGCVILFEYFKKETVAKKNFHVTIANINDGRKIRRNRADGTMTPHIERITFYIFCIVLAFFTISFGLVIFFH